MPRRDTERLAAALWRTLRPGLIRLLDEALAAPEHEGADLADNEEDYIEGRAASQLARYRAKSTGTRRTASAAARERAKP